MRRLVWLALLLMLMVAGNVRADVPLTLFKSWAGNVNFTGTVVSFRNSSSNVCSVYGANTALSVALAGIPTTATILTAQLYWAGSGSTPDYTVGFESGTVTSSAARSYTSQSVGYDFFSGAVDVTAQVQARRNGNYQFYGLTVNNGSPYCDVQGVLSAMSLMVVYADSGQPYRVLHLYEGFQYYQDNSLTTTVSNLRIPSPLTAAMTGRVGHITFEGDGTAGQTGEDIALNGTRLTDTLNPSGNQFNSKSNINGNTASYGIDFDAYTVGAPLIAAGQTSATTRYTSGIDMALLSAQLIALPSVPAVDLAITMTRNGAFASGVAGSYTLSFYNSGTATETGPVTLVNTLPAGVSYLSFSAVRGWDCSASGQVVTCKMNGLFTPNTALPDLTLNVLPTAAGSITNRATVSGVDYDYYTSNNTAADTTTVAKGAYTYVFTDSPCKPNVAFGTSGQCGLLAADTRMPAALAQDRYLTTVSGGVPVARSTSASTTVPLYFAMTCVLPLKNAGVRPTINGTALTLCADGPNPPTAVNSAFSGAISMVFAANAPSSKITLYYADVGKVLLSVREAAAISTSGSIIFRPVSLEMTIDNKAAATVSSTSAVLRAAGVAFPVKVIALMNNKVQAPNFGNGDASIALTPATPSASGSADEKAMAAAMGNLPDLVTTGMNRGSGGAFSGTAAFNEVGVIVMTASVDGGYFGVADVTDAVQQAGRFVPFAFRTTVTPVFAKCTDVFATCPAAPPGAAYATQAFDVAVIPVDAASQEIKNFRGVFGDPITLAAYDSAAGSILNPSGGPTGLTAATIPVLPPGGTNAQRHTAVSYALLRPFDRSLATATAWTGPTAIFLRATAQDTPNGLVITSKQADTTLEAGITILNGRLLLSTVSGSELLRLPVSMKAQFWLPGAGGGWTTNPVDNSATPTSIAFSSCKRNLLVSGACYSGLSMTARDTVFAAGVAKFFIAAPGAGKTGSAMLHMTGAPVWLPSTEAQAVFGAYKSNFLYLREVY